MRTRIEKQKSKRAMVYLTCQEREKKKKTNDHRRPSDHHMPHNVKEDTTTHLDRQRNVKFVDSRGKKVF